MNRFKVVSTMEVNDPVKGMAVRFTVKNPEGQEGTLEISRDKVHSVEYDNTGLLVVRTNKATVGLEMSDEITAKKHAQFLQGVTREVEAYQQIQDRTPGVEKKRIREFEFVGEDLYCLTEDGELWVRRVRKEPANGTVDTYHEWTEIHVGVDIVV